MWFVKNAGHPFGQTNEIIIWGFRVEPMVSLATVDIFQIN